MIIVLATTVVDNGIESRFGQTRLFYLRTVVSVSKHNKNSTDTVGLVQSGHHYHLIECNLFSPWYRWNIDPMLTHSLTHSLILYKQLPWSLCAIFRYVLLFTAHETKLLHYSGKNVYAFGCILLMALANSSLFRANRCLFFHDQHKKSLKIPKR